jgi:hypothetical protein
MVVMLYFFKKSNATLLLLGKNMFSIPTFIASFGFSPYKIKPFVFVLN